MNRVFLFLLMLGVPNVGLTSVYLFDRGELKVMVSMREGQSIQGTTVTLVHDFLPTISADVDSTGTVHFAQVPCGFYTLEISGFGFGKVKYAIYVESGVLKTMNCHAYNYVNVCFIHFHKIPLLGSVYGNTTVYTTDEIFRNGY